MSESLTTGRAFNRHTICPAGSGQRPGNLAEQEFMRWLQSHSIPFRFIGPLKGHSDFITAKRRRLRFDVKAKKRNVQPEPHHEGHVEYRLRETDCDAYIFASVTEDVVTLMGWTTCAEFWRLCEFVVKQEQDSHGFIEKADAGKLRYSEMRPMEELEQWL